MHTEEQASEKWCPMVRMSATDNPCEGNHAANRTSDCRILGLCIASDCMAWRWGKDAWQRPDGFIMEVDKEPRGFGSGGKWVKRGHCGLAGQL